jgi:hypothetical protein
VPANIDKVAPRAREIPKLPPPAPKKAAEKPKAKQK